MNRRIEALLGKSKHFLPTLSVGAVGGGLAFWCTLPLPWLLGALLATTACSLLGIRLHPPKALRKVVLVVIGVLLGSAFSPDIAGDITVWSASLAIMLVVTFIMMAFSVWFCRKIAGYSEATALYSGVPGGLSAVTLMAADSKADLRIVGLTHAVRILILLLAIPPVLNWVGHVSVQARPMDLASWLFFPALDDIVLLSGAGVVGMMLARVLRFPNPLLFGPALLSGALHVSGATEATIPPVIVAMAQIIIGTSVGVRFSGTRLASIGRNMLLAAIQAAVLLVIAILAAWGVHAVTGFSQAAALLAYMPGGAPELSLVALSLGIDPAFVTSHHLLRITVLILLLPMMLKLINRLKWIR